ATVPFGTQGVSLTPTVSAFRIGSVPVAQDGGPPIVVASGRPIQLALPAPGTTSRISVRVTAEDGTTSTSYAILLTRVPPATDAALSALTDSAAALAFDPAQTTFTYAVPPALPPNYPPTP